MNDKPSYLGLLNAIALGEGRAAVYLRCWADTTPHPEVAGVLRSIAIREAEHSMAFEKRLDELGYSVIDMPDAYQDKAMAVASSTTMSDREKFEELKLHRPPTTGKSDIFDKFFENKDIDPITGGLLGRYVAEERDSGRRFAACYDALEAMAVAAPATPAAKKPRKAAARAAK